MDAEIVRKDLIEEFRSTYSEERCTDIQHLVSALANPLRFRMLCALRQHSFTVGELVEITGSQLSNISQHLKMMWIAGYITKQKDGRQVVYSLTNEAAIRVIDLLEQAFPPTSYRSASRSEEAPEPPRGARLIVVTPSAEVQPPPI